MKAKKICAGAMVLPYRLCFIGKQKSDDLAKRLIAFYIESIVILTLLNYSARSFSALASLTAVANTSAAILSSFSGGNVGAILMFESSGSFP